MRRHRPRSSDPHQPRRPRWRRDAPAPRAAPDGVARLSAGAAILYGWHTVKAALENPARLGPDAVHNGLLAEVDALPAVELEQIEPAGLVLVLDQITDPHNVGAILRTAAAFGVKAVVITARHSPDATGVLAKSASGALEYVPIVTVQNLARALATLRERGYYLVGLDSTGERDLREASLRTPLALVLGAEGKGLRQLTRTSCDEVARLALPGQMKTLNVSNAAALALYVASERAN
jgi:23S rRNA (guanosine2251-2'-O)-methyltransferase